MRNSKLSYISIYSILFFTGNIGFLIGLKFNFFIFYYSLVFLISIFNHFKLNIIKDEITIFVLLSLLLLYKGLSISDSGGYFYIISSIAIPVFILSTLILTINTIKKERIDNYRKSLFKIVITFFLIECGIAIIEKGLNHYIFSSGIAGVDEGINLGFRSASLLGHPLQNALGVSIIMSFILISQMKQYYKFSLFFIGWISLLCFNTRSSILIWGILITIVILKLLLFNKKIKLKNKINITFLFFIGVYIITQLILQYHWGDRLISNELMDGSAQTRINVYDIFKYLNIKDLVWGISETKIEIAKNKALCPLIENSFVLFILHFGIVYTLILTIVIAKITNNLLRDYTLFQKFFILLTFVSISSVNNSLAVSSIPLSIFFICSITFNPHPKNK